MQRIGQSTRRGGPDSLKLERFSEAVHDKSARLSFPAFTGQRKQSIRDVENFFSEPVEQFMRHKGIVMRLDLFKRFETGGVPQMKED